MSQAVGLAKVALEQAGESLAVAGLVASHLVHGVVAVSYTHLTLPANREVEISAADAELKKKKHKVKQMRYAARVL